MVTFAIASLYVSLEDYDNARIYFKKTYKIAERNYGGNKQALGSLKIRIAQCYKFAGKYTECVDLLKEAVRFLAGHPGELEIAKELLAKAEDVVPKRYVPKRPTKAEAAQQAEKEAEKNANGESAAAGGGGSESAKKKKKNKKTKKTTQEGKKENEDENK